ncbi:MAG: hypothetical protein ACR2KM_04160 [Gemmatimonadaceae bacterium]
MSRDMTLGALQVSSPIWAGSFIESDDLLPGGAKLDPAAFPAVTTPAFTVTATAPEAAGATTVAVVALPYALPAGTMLNFGIPGKLARLTVAAAAGALALTVAPLSSALVGTETAAVPATRGAIVLAGAVVSRTLAQRDAKVGFHPAIATEDEIFIVAFGNTDVQKVADIDLILPSRDFVIKENFLPGFAGLDAALVTKLRGLYTLTVGRA